MPYSAVIQERVMRQLALRTTALLPQPNAVAMSRASGYGSWHNL
jgi:hypothetical protein